MEASVPVFGNCCLDLPADSDGVSEDNVSADADTLADSDALVDAGSDADVLADADALVDADSDADVLADWLAPTEREALSLKLKFGLSLLSESVILDEVLVDADSEALVDADSDADVLADWLALVDAD